MLNGPTGCQTGPASCRSERPRRPLDARLGERGVVGGVVDGPAGNARCMPNQSLGVGTDHSRSPEAGRAWHEEEDEGGGGGGGEQEGE